MDGGGNTRGFPWRRMDTARREKRAESERIHMKYRAIIADDEAKIIRLIEQLGRWEELGIEICDTCTTGSAALASILRLQPDFVLSDIKMPGLDGLELITRVRAEGISPLFILISGYRHFEYARTAVSLSVMDYLLKPIDEAQLNETLSRVCRRIDQLRSQQADTREAQSLRRTKERQQTERLFDELILGNRALAKRHLLSEETCNARYGTRFAPGCYRALCVFSNLSELMGGNTSMSDDRIEKCMRESFPEYVVRCWKSTYRGTILLLNHAPERRREVRQAIDAFYYSVRNLREVFGDFRLHIGVSRAHASIAELCEAVDEAHAAEWARLTVSKDGILEYSQIAGLAVFSGDMLLPAPQRREIVDCVRYLRREELGRLMETLSRRMTERVHQSPQGVMEAFFQLKSELTADLPQAQSRELTERIDYAYVNSSSYAQLVSNLYQALAAHIDELLRQASEKKGKPIAMAVRLIREHYAEQLSLEGVAEQIFVSPKYLSHLFKEEMGSGFNEYLTQVRLEAAEKLLSSSALTVREIAAQVGYLDEKYFSRLFKKETGLKPTEYRRIYG